MTQGYNLDFADQMRLDTRLREVESRVTALETGVSVSAIANRFATDSQAAALTVSGLALVPDVGRITVRWNPVQDPTVTFYEIEISPDVQFPTPISRFTSQLEYTFSDQAPDVDYFIRVRARTTTGVGPYSGVLSSKTGFASPPNLSVGAVSNIVRREWGLLDDQPFEIGGFTASGGAVRNVTASIASTAGLFTTLDWAPMNTAGWSFPTYGLVFPIEIQTIGGFVELAFSMHYRIAIAYGLGFRIFVLRDGVEVVDLGGNELSDPGITAYDNALTSRGAYSALLLSDAPGVDIHLYEVMVEIHNPSKIGTANHQFFIDRAELQAQELRR